MTSPIPYLTKLLTIRSKINDHINSLIKKEGELSVYKQQLADANEVVFNTENILFDYEKQKILIKGMYNISLTQMTKIEALCTVALRDILQDNKITFKIKMVETKKGVDTYFYTLSDAGENDVASCEAGGTKNILSVCLRLIFCEFCSPKVQGPIILDEVGANISEEYQCNFIEFLKQFSEKNNRQIILISHIEAAQNNAPKLVKVTRHNNASKVIS